MLISKTKRAINIAIYMALFGFLTHYADQAFDHMATASSAFDHLQARWSR